MPRTLATFAAATTAERSARAGTRDHRRGCSSTSPDCAWPHARPTTWPPRRASAASSGTATAIGHAGGFDPFGAALVNGTAAHGEDYDDTFEGGPVHSGAVVVPAVLAASETGLAGDAVVKGIATGVEIMCRLSLVAPQATHKAGFHPTAVFGALAAAGGVAAALGLAPAEIAPALGIAGSMASGIIEYLAEGTWTKRMHAGAAAQSGHPRGADGGGGFTGPARCSKAGTASIARSRRPDARFRAADSTASARAGSWRRSRSSRTRAAR